MGLITWLACKIAPHLKVCIECQRIFVQDFPGRKACSRECMEKEFNRWAIPLATGQQEK